MNENENKSQHIYPEDAEAWRDPIVGWDGDYPIYWSDIDQFGEPKYPW